MAAVNDDLISREAALGCFHDWIDKYGDVHTPDEMLEYRAIEQLPSAERKNGRWVRIEDENGDFLCWECSECGDRYVMPYHRASYCPNCGAEMRGEEDDADTLH